MKYLQDYMEDKQTALFEECGAFFAFSNEQLKEGCAKIGVDYNQEKLPIVSMGYGMYVKRENAKQLADGLEQISTDSVAQDIADHGLEKIILRELGNHEAWYTGNTDSTWDALEGYPGITLEHVNKLHRNRNYKIPTNE